MNIDNVNIKLIKATNLRVDASYHLSEGQEVKRLIDSCPYDLLTIKDVSTDIFIGGRAKRVFVSKRENGIPFLSSSDILQADLENVKLVSKKYMPKLERMKLKKGWTLISRSGTIGNCAFANAKHAQKLASEDVIRVIPNNILREGLIYAYLASRYGYSLLTQGTFGAVIQHIEPSYVGSLPIPNFPEAFQLEVDNLIQESARLREEATDALEEAKDKLEKYINISFNSYFKVQSKGISISKIRESLNTRMDSTVYINSAVEVFSHHRTQYKCLKNYDVIIWYPGIFKRSYIKNGLPYIKGSSLFNVNPFKSCDHLSKARTPMLEQLWLKEGQILMTCAGSCGQVKLITKEYEDKKAIGSPDIIRIQSNDSLVTPEYLFVYFQVPFVNDFMQSMKYGSVIERYDAEHAGSIPILEPSKELSEEITLIIKHYMECTYRAFNAEEEAISMIETEIEKWKNS